MMTRTQQIVFAGWFLGVIFAVPLTQAGLEIARGRRPQFCDVFVRIPTRNNLRLFERQLEDSSAFAQAIRPWFQYVWFVLLRDAGEKVVPGRHGWLFYRPDLRYLVEPARPDGADDPFQAIAAFRDDLARRGIRLLVLPVPGKPSVYPDEVTSRAHADGSFHSHTLGFVARLRAAGIETPDLFSAFAGMRHHENGESLYLRRDTHWSCETAGAAAKLIAERIRSLGWLEPGSVQYGLRKIRVLRRSDIARMIRAPAIERQFPAEPVRCWQVVRDSTGELYRDDPDSPVLVLGDSFLRMYETDEPRSAGFVAHLARELRMPIASIVNDGGASTLVRQELNRRPELLAGKKLIVWEFVERDLRFGTEGWKIVPLPGGRVTGTVSFTQAPSRNP